MFGEAIETRGTVADIVEGRVASPPMNALVERLLGSTLRVEPAAEPMHVTPSNGDIEVHIALRNMSTRRVIEERFQLKIGRTALNCGGDGKNVAIEPNAAAPWVCTTHSSLVTPAQLASDLKQPAWILLSVTSLAFEDPTLSVNRAGASWDNNDRVFNPWQTARAELDALSCWERSACLKESIPTLDRNPGMVFGGVFAGAGLVAGTMIALFTRRRWYWAWILVGVVLACIVGALVWLIMANDLAGFAVLIYGPVALGGFIVGLLPPLIIIKGRRQ